MKRLLLCVLTAACGPSLAELVPAHHYREAICLADQGSQADRAAVLRSLETTGNLLVDVELVPPAPDLDPSVRFARLTFQSDRLPVDGLGVDIGHRVELPRLVALTKEPMPPRRRVTTSITQHNARTVLATIFTGGLWLLTDPHFDTETVELEPNDADYLRTSPRAFALHEAMRDDGECRDWESPDADKRGALTSIRCVRYVILPQDGVIDVGIHYAAFRKVDEPTRDDVCHVKRIAHLRLGPDVDARTKALFGSGMRRLGDVAP